jgi:ATP-binding cassette subfamily B protein
VGDRGLLLSVGERQRIALARAFLRQSPILILDEPTSSVDTDTEASIMEAMERLMNGRTTFMIAHRTSTLAQCDILFRVEQGRLIEMLQPASAAKTEPASVPADSSGLKEVLVLPVQHPAQNDVTTHTARISAAG